MFMSHELANILLESENCPIDFRCNNSEIEVMLDDVYPGFLTDDFGEVLKDPPIKIIVLEINQLK